MSNSLIYDFSRHDDEGIVKMDDRYYEVYLVIDIFKNYYFVIIRVNNFAEDGVYNQLEYFIKVDKFCYSLYFWDKKKMLP